MINKIFDFYSKAILIRCSEEKLLQLYAEGKLNGTVHTCIGQEMNSVAISSNLSENDTVCSNHRGHGHFLAKTNDLKGFFAELLGKKSGCSGGIGGSQHLYSKNFYSNGVQGGMTPIALGLAYGHKINNNNNVSVVYIGDGTFGEGILYESFNLSSLWSLPVLFVVENNKIAQSTSISQNMAGNIENRAKAFGIEYFNTSTENFTDLFEKCQGAVDFVRNYKKPVVIEIETMRLYSHSKGDDNREKLEVEKLKSKDLINVFKSQFPLEFERFYLEATNKIEGVIKGIELEQNVDLESFNRLLEFENHNSLTNMNLISNVQKEDVFFNQKIYDFFNHLFKSNDKVLMFGEDIETSNEFNPGQYGGAFKVTKDLSIRYPGRVRNTPISESVIVGLGSGLAMSGFIPIIEIMFGDFTTLIFDQLLQHASKFRMMFNGKVNVPLIIRTPMGGKRGYGPTHSQSLEKHFLGIPDLKVIALNGRIDPRETYEAVLNKLNSPVLIIENKILYTRRKNTINLIDYNIYETDEEYKSVIISPQTALPKCTIICYGETLDEVENALIKLLLEEEIYCEVFCPTLISDPNVFPVIDSLSKTNCLLVIEEGNSVASWGSEVVTRIVESGVEIKKLIRISNNSIVPSYLNLELDILPNSNLIFNTIKEYLNAK
jgi:2-oxoisovalerate dehydrogenase E1 component